MRLLIIGALLATLIGCCRTPPQASLERCTSKGCIHRTAANPRVELKPVLFRPGPATANVKFTTTAKAPEPASAQPTDHMGLIERNANSAIRSTPEAPPPDRLAETSDTVLKNATTTIAAKMENPASVEFREMKRAERKNAVGKSIDSICGYVRGKTASGEETGDKPFLYLVQEGEAYIGGYSMATSPHHNICN
jgi:hypothetical protein